MAPSSTENGYCPTCDRRETIIVQYNVTTDYSPGGRTDTYSTISAACRHGHPIPRYRGEKD